MNLPGHRPGVPGRPGRPAGFQILYVIFSYVPFLLSTKREADTEFQYRPRIVDTDIDCCGPCFRDSYSLSFLVFFLNSLFFSSCEEFLFFCCWAFFPSFPWILQIKNEKAAQRVSFGAGYPADVHADIPADFRGQKLRSNPRNPGKTSILVRTSMTRRRGTSMNPGGFKKTSVRKTSGWIFGP